jgi:hypothetical protein
MHRRSATFQGLEGACSPGLSGSEQRPTDRENYVNHVRNMPRYKADSQRPLATLPQEARGRSYGRRCID